MPNDTDKILALVNGTLTIQAKKTDQLIEAMGELVKAIKAQKMTVEAPAVNVTTPELKIPDITIPEICIPPIEVPKADVTVTIPEIVVPTPQVTVNVEKSDPPIVNLPAPIVNLPEFPKEMEVSGIRQFFVDIIDAVRSILPYSIFSEVSNQQPVPVVLIDPDGKPYKARGGSSVSYGGGGSGDTRTGLVLPVYDTAVLAQTSTVDTWTLKLLSKTVCTLTITYTDSTKATIANVTKT